MNIALVAKNKLCFVDGSIDKPSIDDPVYGLWSRCKSMVMSWILHFILKDIAESIMYLDSVFNMWSDLYDRFHQGNNPRVFQIKQLLENLVRAQILMLDLLPSINKAFSLIVQEERQRSLSSLNLSQPNVASYGASSSNYNSYKSKNDKPYCTHCGMLGHTIEKCHKVHDYPPGYKPMEKF
ncbi:hypothetical protein UlMin_038132 [Ulmus minor]